VRQKKKLEVVKHPIPFVGDPPHPKRHVENPPDRGQPRTFWVAAGGGFVDGGHGGSFQVFFPVDILTQGKEDLSLAKAQGKKEPNVQGESIFNGRGVAGVTKKEGQWTQKELRVRNNGSPGGKSGNKYSGASFKQELSLRIWRECGRGGHLNSVQP